MTTLMLFLFPAMSLEEDVASTREGSEGILYWCLIESEDSFLFNDPQRRYCLTLRTGVGGDTSISFSKIGMTTLMLFWTPAL